MRPMLYGMLGMAQMFATEMKVGRELKKQEIRERWKNLQNLPRKKKKKEKKHLLLMWSIVNYDPLNMDQFSFF